MQVEKAALFGGALMAAGIAMQPAEGQSFEFDGQVTGYAYVYHGPSASYAEERVSSDGPFELVLDHEGGVGTSRVTESSLFASAVGTPENLVIADARGQLLQSTDIEIELNWDFTGASGFIDIFSPSGAVFDTRDFGYDSAGTALVTLNASIPYTFYLQTSASAGLDDGDSYAGVIIVPAPGFAGLAMLGGTLALRRRR